MIKVEKIIKEVEQIKIAQERTDRQAGMHNEMLNSHLDKAMNMEVKESDLFNLPEKEVRASIKRTLTSYFGENEFPEEFLEKLSKDIYDAKKIDLEIEARVEAGEKREDVEAEVFPDEESRLKHGADLEIYDETAEEEYMQNVEIIGTISAEYGITFQEDEAKFFDGKPDASRCKHIIEQGKYRARIRELGLDLEETERTKESKVTAETEGDKNQSYTLGIFEKRKFDKTSKR